MSAPDQLDGPHCAICLERFQDGDTIRVLECDHCFHKGCVDTWLLGTLSEESTFTSVCPTCKRSVKGNEPTPTSPPSPVEQEVRTHAPPDMLHRLSPDLEVPYSAFASVGELLLMEEGCYSTPSPGALSPITSPAPDTTTMTRPRRNSDQDAPGYCVHPPFLEIMSSSPTRRRGENYGSLSLPLSVD